MAMDPSPGIRMAAGIPGIAAVPSGNAFGKWNPEVLGRKLPTITLNGPPPLTDPAQSSARGSPGVNRLVWCAVMGERTGAGVRYVEGLPATADLVVIGGGVIGAATAFHAVRAGCLPLVVRRRAAFSAIALEFA